LTALWQVAVRANPAREEPLAARLAEALGVPVSVYRDEDTGALTITGYPARIEPSPRRAARALAEALEISARDIAIAPLRRDWATSWKRHFKPIQVGARLLVKPSWSRRRARGGQRVVVLDPGLSFGTGQHETTAFCLRQLCRWRDPQRVQSFLDIGTGSGILAIAAAKLGYAPVEAFDFDPESARAAQANARRNRVDGRVALRRDDLTRMPKAPRRRFDVICANLTYDLLAGEARRISRLLAPEGRLIVAGILASQFEIVTRSFHEFGLTLGVSELKNNWRSGQFAFHSRVQPSERKMM
jgi:ribosomal protein L11 methyltransferase